MLEMKYDGQVNALVIFGGGGEEEVRKETKKEEEVHFTE
jgi:hypothetical protein